MGRWSSLRDETHLLHAHRRHLPNATIKCQLSHEPSLLVRHQRGVLCTFTCSSDRMKVFPSLQNQSLQGVTAFSLCDTGTRMSLLSVEPRLNPMLCYRYPTKTCSRSNSPV